MKELIKLRENHKFTVRGKETIYTFVFFVLHLIGVYNLICSDGDIQVYSYIFTLIVTLLFGHYLRNTLIRVYKSME